MKRFATQNFITSPFNIMALPHSALDSQTCTQNSQKRNHHICDLTLAIPTHAQPTSRLEGCSLLGPRVRCAEHTRSVCGAQETRGPLSVRAQKVRVSRIGSARISTRGFTPTNGDRLCASAPPPTTHDSACLEALRLVEYAQCPVGAALPTHKEHVLTPSQDLLTSTHPPNCVPSHGNLCIARMKRNRGATGTHS